MPKFSNDPVFSESSSTEPAVQGIGNNGTGVRGMSHNAQAGVMGKNDAPLPGGNGGWFESENGEGVRGWSKNPNHGGVVGTNTGTGAGVFGQSDGTGVWGVSKTWMGVYGNPTSTTGGAGVMGEAIGPGVIGKSQTWMGVYGETSSSTGGAGVWGEHKSSGSGVVGKSATGVGVFGKSEAHEGIKGETNSTFFAAVAGISLNSNRDQGGGGSAGIFGKSEAGEGVHGETNSNFFAAVAGIQLNPNSTGAGVYGEHRGNGPAGFFKGDVLVTGDIKLINADCAEDFDIAGLEEVEPGTVMVIDSEGALRQSDRAYDKRVAGVISGAGNYKPGIVLDKQNSSNNRMPIALLGKVYCKVDASYGAIEVGDLLTTSPTPGHAMRVDDPFKALGTIIGKALRPLADDQGLIPILIALQ